MQKARHHFEAFNAILTIAIAAKAFTVSTGGLGALALGVAAGTVGAAGAVTTHCIASECTRSEESFNEVFNRKGSSRIPASKQG